MKTVATKNGGCNVYVPTVNGADVRLHFPTREAGAAFVKAASAATIVRYMG